MTIAQQFIDKDIKYLEYDFQARKERRDEQIDKKVATENLLLFKTILDNANIEFFLLYGTVLGAIRENDFIEYDTDTDTGIFEEDREKLLKAIPKLLDNGFELIRTKVPDDLVTFMRNDEYIDIGIFSLQKGYYTYQNNLIDKYFLDTLESVNFLGETFLVPSKTELYLEKNYGKDWKTPIKGEPSMNLGWKNYYFRFKRVFLKTRFGQIVKVIVKKVLGRK